MIRNKIDLRKLIITLVMAATAITIASLTIGRDIYGTTDQSLLSFGIVNFSGYLFFLFMPVEIAYIYYVASGIQPLFLFLTALATATAAQLIDYLIGYSFSKKFIFGLIGRNRYRRAEAEIRKYGNITIFLFNVLPLSSPVIALVAGMLKHKLKDTILFSLAGLTVKYVLLSLLFS